MSSPSYDWRDEAFAEWLALQQDSVRNVAKEEETTTPEQKAQQEARRLAWLAERDANDAKKKAPKPRKARKAPKPPQAPNKETSRKRKRPTDDPENGGGQATTTSSNNPEDGPPKKRSRGRPKGSKNKPKPGQQQALAEAQQQPSPPAERSPVNPPHNAIGHTGSSLSPVSLPPSPSPLQERGPEGLLNNLPAAQSEASQQPPLPQASADYFRQALAAAFGVRKTSPPSLLTPPQEKASVASAQNQAQSEPMPDSAERDQDQDQNDDVEEEDNLVEEFESLEDEDDLFGDQYVEVASAQSEPMPDSEQGNEGEESDDDSENKLLEDSMNTEDPDDLFGDQFVENHTIAQVQHDPPKAATSAPSTTAPGTASATASSATSSTITPSTVVSGPGSGSGAAFNAASTTGHTPSAAASETEIDAEIDALIDANLEGIQEAPELAVPGPALGVEFRAAWPGASNVASSAPPGTASRPTPTRVVGSVLVGRAQPGAQAMSGYGGQRHLNVAGAGMSLGGSGQMMRQQQVAPAVQKMASMSSGASTAASGSGSGAVFGAASTVVSTAVSGTASATVASSARGSIAFSGSVAASASLEKHKNASAAQPRASQPLPPRPSVLPAGRPQQAIGHRNSSPHSLVPPPPHRPGAASVGFPWVQQPQTRQQVQRPQIYQEAKPPRTIINLTHPAPPSLPHQPLPEHVRGRPSYHEQARAYKQRIGRNPLPDMLLDAHLEEMEKRERKGVRFYSGNVTGETETREAKKYWTGVPVNGSTVNAPRRQGTAGQPYVSR